MTEKKTYKYIDAALLEELQAYIDEHYVPEVEYPCCSEVSAVTRLMDKADEEPRFKGLGFFGRSKGASKSATVEERESVSVAEPRNVSAAPAGAAAKECYEGASDVEFPGYLEEEEPVFAAQSFEMAEPMVSGSGKSLKEALDAIDEPFSTTVLKLIDMKGLKDSDVYKRANMSRQLFSKIRSDSAYRPTKKTAVALAVAMQLGIQDTQDLLARAGFTLSDSSKFDLIVKWFIEQNDFNVFKINEALYENDQPVLC